MRRLLELDHRRALIIAAITIAATLISWLLFPINHGADFAQFHFAARNWLSGANAYDGGYPIMRATRVIPEPFFYPFPTLLAIAPFALMPLRVAMAAFVAASTALLAFGLFRRSYERAPMFLGAGFLVALGLGQWSPLVTATFLIPTLAWLAILKPNIGLAVTVSHPSWIGVIGGIALLTATLALQPTWPIEWLRNLRSMPAHPAPVMLPGGALTLLALLRWRRVEARLLVAMVCVPQLMYFADQLPLWLVPQTRRESMLLSATSLAAWAMALITTVQAGRQPPFDSALFVLLGIYLPALAMVMRRPNEGLVPAWVERVVRRAPAWLRGQSAMV